VTDPDDGDRLELELRPDPKLPWPYDAYIGVWTLDDGRLQFATVVRPGLDEVAIDRVADWVMARVARLIRRPDGSEPDAWQVHESGYRYAFHTPDDGPDWTDLL
jgi:hypothetical protein